MTRRIAEAWKAVLAFLSPAVLLVGERLLLSDGDVDGPTVQRAVLVGLVTAVLVYFKSNGHSPDPSTSTPGPGGDTGHAVIEIAIVVCLILLVLVVAGIL